MEELEKDSSLEHDRKSLEFQDRLSLVVIIVFAIIFITVLLTFTNPIGG